MPYNFDMNVLRLILTSLDLPGDQTCFFPLLSKQEVASIHKLLVVPSSTLKIT